MDDAAGSGIQHIAAEECWALLDDHDVGRLAYHLVDEVHIVPLNYVVAGHEIYIRTHSGNKLLAAALSSDVALEIDYHDEESAWSVVARGRLRRLEPPEHAPLLDFPRRPWFVDEEVEVVELVPESIEGRRFGVPSSVRS